MASRLDSITDWETLARQAKFKVGVVARSAGISPERLRLYVQIRFKKSTKDWLTELRMREARRLLARGQLVKEIAHILGFEHATHFSRAFRTTLGNSPTEFRARGDGRERARRV